VDTKVEVSWPSQRRAWLAVAVLLVAYTCSFVDRTLLSLLVEPIKADLGLSDTEIGLLHGVAFAIFYTLLGLPIAMLADRFDRRTIIAVAISFWSLMTAACGFANSFAQLFLARIGVAAGEAGLSPPAYSLIADSFPPAKLGRAMSVYTSGVYIGAGLAFIIGGSVIAAVRDSRALTFGGFGPFEPWQLAFVVVGLPGLLIAALVLAIREPARRGKAGEKAATAGEAARHLARHRAFFACHFLGFALLTAAFNAAAAWAPALLHRRFGIGAGEAGLGLGIAVLVFGTAGLIAGGWLTDRWRSRGIDDGPLRVGVISGVGLVPFAIAAPLAPSDGLAVALLCPFMFFVSLALGSAVAALQMVTPNRMRAVVSASYLFVNNLLGIGLGPLCTALVTDYVFRDELALPKSLAVVAGASAALAAVLLHYGRGPYRRALPAH
jgi:MFS family permease